MGKVATAGLDRKLDLLRLGFSGLFVNVFDRHQNRRDRVHYRHFGQPITALRIADGLVYTTPNRRGKRSSQLR